MNQLELRMCASAQYLCVARMAVRRSAELAGMDEDDTDKVILAVEEALNNVIQHSYGGPCDNPMFLQLRQVVPGADRPTYLEIIVRDFGRQVDPKSIQGRDLDDVRPGGLGVHIIRSVMDEIEYTTQSEGGMKLRMIKHIKS